MKSHDHGWCPGGSENRNLNPIRETEPSNRTRCLVCNKLLKPREMSWADGHGDDEESSEHVGWTIPPHKAKKPITVNRLAKATQKTIGEVKKHGLRRNV